MDKAQIEKINTYTLGMPKKSRLLSNKSKMGTLKAINSPRLIRMSFCSCLFFIFSRVEILVHFNKFADLKYTYFCFLN